MTERLEHAGAKRGLLFRYFASQVVRIGSSWTHYVIACSHIFEGRVLVAAGLANIRLADRLEVHQSFAVSDLSGFAIARTGPANCH